MNKFFKNLNLLDNKVKILIGVCIILLLVALFYPRTKQMGIKLEPVPGTSYYQAVFENFNDDNKPALVFFGTEWCGYCKKFKPEWDKFASQFNKMKVVYIDCDKNKELAEKHNIKGFPTVKYLPNGLNNPAGSQQMTGGNSFASLVDFIANYS